MLDPELRQRAIIGGLLGVTYDILERPRPRAQYIHYWRSLRKKILETIPDLEDPRVLKDLLGILQGYPKLKNSDSIGIATDMRSYFTREGLISI